MLKGGRVSKCLSSTPTIPPPLSFVQVVVLLLLLAWLLPLFGKLPQSPLLRSHRDHFNTRVNGGGNGSIGGRTCQKAVYVVVVEEEGRKVSPWQFEVTTRRCRRRSHCLPKRNVKCFSGRLSLSFPNLVRSPSWSSPTNTLRWWGARRRE